MIYRLLSFVLLLLIQLLAAACRQTGAPLAEESPTPAAVAGGTTPTATAPATAPPPTPTVVAANTATAPPPTEDPDGAPTLPPPPPLVVDGSQPLGTAPVAGELIYDDAFLVRLDVRRPGAGGENGAGIDRVEFFVSRDGSGVYRHTDDTPAFCIFGGGQPTCHAWPLEADVYRWGTGGPPIEPGHYLVRAWLYFTPESDDGSGITHDFWDFTFDLATPGPSRLGP